MKNSNYRYGTYALHTGFFLVFFVQTFRAYVELSPEFAGEALEEYHLMYFPIIAIVVGLVLFIYGWWKSTEAQHKALSNTEQK
jgi:cytochrome c-type biogenesis protein CcmH/NrfF